MMPEHYQIKEVKEIYQHAGSKAVEDVCRFAGEVGYTPLYIRQRAEDTNKFRVLQNQWGFLCDWAKTFLHCRSGSILLLQNPFKRKQLGRNLFLKLLKKVKKCSFISVIHDVEELRGFCYRAYHTSEFAFMKENSDMFIVHNDSMKQYFISRGFKEENLISLGIFDYALQDFSASLRSASADIAVAGNLEKAKCPYIYSLGTLSNPLNVHLYGPNYEAGQEQPNIQYKGTFPAEEVPNVLDARFGLVWDGDCVDCCSGEAGNYLRYNNPHKTSLYLVSRLPVIIWKQAAMARFIQQENVGLCVESLEEIRPKIDALSAEDYARMQENVERIAQRLEQGYYLKTALATCESRILK